MAIPLSSSLKLFGGVTSALAGAYGGWHFYDRGIGGYGGWGNRKAPVQDQEQQEPGSGTGTGELQDPAPANPKVDQGIAQEQPNVVQNQGENRQVPQVQNGHQPQAQQQLPADPQKSKLNCPKLPPQEEGRNGKRKNPLEVDSDGECSFKDNEHKENFSFLVQLLTKHEGKLENLKGLDGSDSKMIKEAMEKTKTDLEDDYYKDKLEIEKDAWRGLIDLLQKIMDRGSVDGVYDYHQKFNSDMEKIKSKFIYTLPPQMLPQRQNR